MRSAKSVRDANSTTGARRSRDRICASSRGPLASSSSAAGARAVRDRLTPNFHCGVLAAGAERVGGKNVKAVGRQTGPLEAVYDVTWE